MYLHVPQVLNEDQLAILVGSLQSADAPWVDGRQTAGHQGALVKKNQQLDEASPMARELGGRLLATLERNATFVSAVLPHRIFPPMFNRYGGGMHFGTHVDGTIRALAGTAQRVRTDVSATLFLTPPDSYDGGELFVENDLGSQSIKLAAGDMVVYSAAARHRVNPVIRGQRLAAVFWAQSLIRGDAERILLFELDRTIQELTRSGADPGSLVRLAAHYHALLRLWAEV